MLMNELFEDFEWEPQPEFRGRGGITKASGPSADQRPKPKLKQLSSEKEFQRMRKRLLELKSRAIRRNDIRALRKVEAYITQLKQQAAKQNITIAA